MNILPALAKVSGLVPCSLEYAFMWDGPRSIVIRFSSANGPQNLQQLGTGIAAVGLGV